MSIETLRNFVNKFKKFKLTSKKIHEITGEETLDIDRLMNDPALQKDISSDQDLTVALMNLIGIEEHLFFTGAKIECEDKNTEKEKKKYYYSLLNEVREIRKSLLAKIIKQYEGEVWCISKHLLAASYRLMEVGTKQMSLGKEDEAFEFFETAYELYSLFWGINIKMRMSIDEQKNENISTIASKVRSDEDDKSKNLLQKKDSSPKKIGKFKSLVKKIVNCCIE